MQALAPDAVASLLLCTRTPVDGDMAKRVLALARSEPEWEALLTAANEHSVMPVFCKNLEAYAGEALASSWRQRFNEEFLRNSCRNLALTAELFRLLEAFESHGVCASPYKGPVLAAQASNDVALRQFSDLDIMVPQRQIAAAHEALLSLGFLPLAPGVLQAAARTARPAQIPGQY